MKDYRFLFISFLFSAGMTAQDSGSITLNLYGTYTFSNNIDFDYGHIRVGDGFTYGTGLEFFPQKSSSIELKYLRLDTKMSVSAPGQTVPEKYRNGGDGAFNYILLGGNHYFDNGGSAVPYLGGALGMAIVEGPFGGSDTNFAWEIKGGVKIKTASIVSVSLQANLISTVTPAGSDTYWGYWGPVAIQDYAYSYQFGLGAIIGFNFK